MSIGFPDGQRITQWLGAPVVQAAAAAIGNVLHEDGPFQLSSWASVIVAVKPTGGNVTVTLRQRISGGPAALELDETFVVAAGQTLFESIVLFGDVVYLDLTGSAPGVTVDYALYPSNTTTNAQVLASATLNVQHNEVLVAAEPTLDFVDPASGAWTITDDGPNTRVKIIPPASALTPIADLVLGVDTALPAISAIPATAKHLLLMARYRVTGGAGPNFQGIRFNGVAGARYGCQVMNFQGGALAASNFGAFQSAIPFGEAWGVTADPLALSWATVDIPDYTDATLAMRLLSRFAGYFDDAAGGPGANGYVGGHTTGMLDATAALGPITSLTFVDFGGGNFKAGSRFTLYGLS